MNRKLLLRNALLVILFIGVGRLNANGQGMAVNTTGTAATASAMLDVQSTNQGMLVPRIATPATAITSPATGLMVYNTTTNQFNFYNGTAWTVVGDGAGTGTASGDLTGNYPNPTISSSAGTGNNIITAINASTGGLNGTKLATNSVSVNALSATGTPSSTTYLRGDNTWQPVTGGSGTVTSVSSGSLTPIFQTTVSNATTTPTINYSLNNAPIYSVLTNSIGAISTPVYGKVVPQALQNLGGTANSTTYYRGDGQWVTPTSSGSNTNMNWQPATGGNAISFTSGVYGSLTSTSGSTTAPYPFNNSSQAYDICPVACTLDAFAMSGNCRVTGTGATNFTATVMKNGSATSLAVTINVPNGATVGQALSPVLVTGSVSVSAGDILYLQWTNDNSAGPGPDLGWSIHAH